MKSLFFSFVFLLLGCVKLFAHQATVVQAMPNFTGQHQYCNENALLIHQDFIFSSIHTNIEANHRTVYTTDNEQVEEEESITAKKATSVATFPKVLDLEKFATLKLALKKEFPPRNYFVYFPSNTIQILFCTFRI